MRSITHRGLSVAADRQGLATAVAGVCDKTVFGDLIVASGVPIPLYGMPTFKRVARVMLPVVSYFPMSLIFYGSDGAEHEPKYVRYVKTAITTTPRYDGRSFGTNMMEAALTAYAGKGRRLSDDKLNALIDELELKPSVINC